MTQAIHDIFDSNYRLPSGAVRSGTTVRLSVDSDEKPQLLIWFGSESLLLDPTEETTLSGFLTRYHFSFLPEQSGLYWYRFLFAGKVLTVAQDGVSSIVADPGTYESFQLTVYDRDFKLPDWVFGRVMYQIFPDRFARDPSVPLSADRIYRAWNSQPIYDILPGCDLYTGYDFCGGNLKGIESHLDYLKDLGISLIYLNPVFEGCTNHRYDTSNYEKIDRDLGREKDFENLCSSARSLDIRIICDGVFSHTGDRSIYFDRLKEHGTAGACSNPDSPYFSWYRFRNWPDDYACWWGFKSLPEVNEENPSYLSFITGENGIARKWLRQGSSGWRLDVADELPDVFLDTFRSSVKSYDPEALIIGEVWEDASNKISYGQMRRYLLGKQLDSVMNYPFRRMILDFCMQKSSASDFALSLKQILSHYPSDSLNASMTFLSTHDTPRISSLFAGMDENSTRDEAKAFVYTEENLNLSFFRHRAAVALLFTLPGIPCIFYGDELGLLGGPDPLCRVSFPEDGFICSSSLKSCYQTFAHIRKRKALACGETTVSAIGNELIIRRFFPGETAELKIHSDTLAFSFSCGNVVLSDQSFV